MGVESPPEPYDTFEAAPWSPTIHRIISRLQFGSPTPIQAQCWPIALSGKDMVAISATGSGKTLGYVLPALSKIESEFEPVTARKPPNTLILAPTRELVEQIAGEAQRLGQTMDLNSAVVVGGQSKRPQAQALLSGPSMVIATPGRMIDMLESGYTSVEGIKYLVLDEADRMLDMGFGDQIKRILREMPEHQTLMFSATWPQGVQSIARNYMKDFAHVTVGALDLAANKNITQKVEFVRPADKRKALIRHLEELSGSVNKVLIFVGTKVDADTLSHFLHQDGWPVFAMHGDKTQGERTRLLEDFRSGRQLVMIATDVASRGLDVSDVTCVINYDMPRKIDDYIHRIGRTARGHRSGTSIAFFTENDAEYAPDLVKVMQDANQQIPSELLEVARRRESMRNRHSGFGAKRAFGNRIGQGRSNFGSGRDSRSSLPPPTFRRIRPEGQSLYGDSERKYDSL